MPTRADGVEKAESWETTASDAFQTVSDATSDLYFRAVEYTRAHPRNGVLIALGVGLAVGCLLGRGSGRGSGSGLLGSLALAAGGAALDAFRAEVE